MPRRPTPIAPAPRRNKTSVGGCFRFDRDFRRIGVGRLQMSAGTDDPAEFKRRNAIITKLALDCQIETLRALQHREVSIEEVVYAYEAGRLDRAVDDSRRRRTASSEVVSEAVSQPLGLSSLSGAASSSSGTDIAAVVALLVPTLRALGVTGTADAAVRFAASGINSTRVDATAATDLAFLRWPDHESLHLGLSDSDPDDARLLAELREAPLWKTLTSRIPLLDSGKSTRRRYATSLESLRRRLKEYQRDDGLQNRLDGTDPAQPTRDFAGEAMALLRDLASDDATVADLLRVTKWHWRSLHEHWPRSASDWNHVRRALSATLTSYFRSSAHRVRRAVIDAVPLATEDARLPDLMVQDFWRIVDLMPEHARPGPVILVATGLRLGEYMALNRSHLRPNVHGIVVPGSKTPDSQASIFVAEEIWGWIESGVPAPLRERWLGVYWRRAREEAGIPDVTLHDLRHCLGQWATDTGVPEKSVQWALRHRDPNMTRRYTQTRGKREVATAIGKVLRRPRKKVARNMAKRGRKTRLPKGRRKGRGR